MRGRGREQGQWSTEKALTGSRIYTGHAYCVLSPSTFGASVQWLPDTFGSFACCHHTFQELKLPGDSERQYRPVRLQAEDLVPGLGRQCGWVCRVPVLITEETGCPAQCPTLQQRRVTQVCVFTIKLGATNPTPSTKRESTHRGPPRRGPGEIPTHQPRLREPAGSECPKHELAADYSQGPGDPNLRGARDGHAELPPEASPDSP